jgi:hypothetical protein
MAMDNNYDETPPSLRTAAAYIYINGVVAAVTRMMMMLTATKIICNHNTSVGGWLVFCR